MPREFCECGQKLPDQFHPSDRCEWCEELADNDVLRDDTWACENDPVSMTVLASAAKPNPTNHAPEENKGGSHADHRLSTVSQG